MKSFKVFTYTVGQLQTNCYLVADTSGQAVIIDPGDDADYLYRQIQTEQLKPKVIVATHGHFDHLGAVTELKTAFNIPFTINQKDTFLVSRFRSSTLHFLNFDPGPAPAINYHLTNPVVVGNMRFSILPTPGHTPGSICLYSSREKVAFVGDLIFAEGGLGRTDFRYSSSEDLHHSLEKILSLPQSTTLYPGHGPDTTVAAELPFH